MFCTLRKMFCGLCVVAVASVGHAQPPSDAGGGSAGGTASSTAAVDKIVARMMAFDKNKDGKLTKDEITDPRLLRLFERADANHDGEVTKDELTALAKKMVAEIGSGGGGRSGRGGPGGGFGGGPDDGPGGPGGGMGRGPRPQPGQVLSPRMQEMLSLSTEQTAKVKALQKEVDAKLTKILTDEQKSQLKEIGNRGGNGPPPPRGEDR